MSEELKKEANNPSDNTSNTSNEQSWPPATRPANYSSGDDEEEEDQEEPQAFTSGYGDGQMRVLRRTTTTESAMDHGREELLQEVFSRTSSFAKPLPPMGAGKPYPPLFRDIEQYKVEFDGPDDPTCPLNWPLRRKVKNCMILLAPMFSLVWGSSAYGTATTDIKEIYHVGTPVAVLGVSLFVLGFATGPVLWGPLSELYGRRMPLVVSCVLYVSFTFWSATVDHFYHMMLYRFFAAALGSAPLAVVPAAFADLLPTVIRGSGISLFTMCVMGGPMLAPVVCGYIANSYLGWRWCFYITGIIAALSLVLVVLFCEETYHPLVLVDKAKELRERTGNPLIYAAHERIEVDLNSVFHKVLALPVKMCIKEPILLLMSLYHGFVYGILYLCLQAVPIIFSKYEFKGGNLYLPYLSMFTGVVIFTMLDLFVTQPRFHRSLARSGKPVVPELRLPPMILGGILFPIGIFWLCWTGNYYRSVHWIAPVIGMSFIGAGLIGIFLPVFNYLLDTYLTLAASALAANTMIRCLFATAFPIFATAMFNNLGTEWAGTLLGCLAVIMVPIPVCFLLFGARLRARSVYAANIE